MRRKAVLVVVGLLAAASLQATPVGHIVALEGQVQVLPGGQEAAAVTAILNTAVSMGDVVATGPVSKAKVLFVDDTVLNLGPKTSVRLDEKVYDPGEKERVSKVRVLWGTIRAIVHKGLGGGKEFEVETDTAVIGVKGTHFIVDADASPSFDGRDGPCAMGILLSGSGIQVRNPEGAADVNQVHYGSVACSPPSHPRLVPMHIIKQYLDQTTPTSRSVEDFIDFLADAGLGEGLFNDEVLDPLIGLAMTIIDQDHNMPPCGPRPDDYDSLSPPSSDYPNGPPSDMYDGYSPPSDSIGR
jgi:hypothetical protein